MTVYEMAKKYYPQYWDLRRINALVTAGRLSQEEADEIIQAAEAAQEAEPEEETTTEDVEGVAADEQNR